MCETKFIHDVMIGVRFFWLSGQYRKNDLRFLYHGIGSVNPLGILSIIIYTFDNEANSADGSSDGMNKVAQRGG